MILLTLATSSLINKPRKLPGNARIRTLFLLATVQVLTCAGQSSLTRFSFKNFYAEADILLNPYYDDFPILSDHLYVGAGYQFNPWLGVGFSYGYFYKRVGSKYPVISFTTPFAAMEYRITKGRYFGKFSLGHIPQVDGYGESFIAMDYCADKFTPGYQVKMGLYFLRFLSAGLLGFRSSAIDMPIKDHSTLPATVNTESFHFHTVQVFMGMGLPGYQKRK